MPFLFFHYCEATIYILPRDISSLFIRNTNFNITHLSIYYLLKMQNAVQHFLINSQMFVFVFFF